MTAPPDAGRGDLPTGTVTFLRTDVQGSMGLARALGARWDDLNRRHLERIGRAVAAHGGTIIRTEGDALFAAFPEAIAAVEAAAEAQRAVATEAWPDDVTIWVRIGLHTGEAHRSGDDYGGFDVNRAARVAAVGHGGQVVLSETTADPRRRCPAPGDEPARPRPTRPEGRATGGEAEPTRYRRPAERLPTASGHRRSVSATCRIG